jgi:hypothetical protein
MAGSDNGGMAIIRHYSVTTAGGQYILPNPVKRIVINNDTAFALRVYATAADFAADINFIPIDATTGFIDVPWAATTLWLRAIGGTANPVIVLGIRA